MNVYLAVILAILIGDYLLEVIADILNVRRISTDLPEEFRGYYDSSRYEKAQNYLKAQTKLEILSDSILTPVTIAFILLGGFNVADRCARSFNMGTVPTGLIFAGMLMLLSQFCCIPFSVYRTFVIEERYGFNRTTPGTFVTDILKKWFLGLLIGGAMFSTVVLLFKTAGAFAWLYCWIVVALVQVLLTFIAPAVIMPMFNRFIPLEEGELKTAIESYARSKKFKLRGIFTMDASRRTTKSNAFFTGFGRFRRIALFDTLIERHTVDEVVSVIAHEIGHFKKKHIFKALAVMLGSTGLMFFILSLFINNRELFDAFRMSETSVYASIFFFGFLYTPIQMLVSIFSNMLSRKHEFEADAYTALTYGKPESMITALKKLSVDNLTNLTPHPFKVVLFYTHPPILQRIRALRDLEPSALTGETHR